MHRAGLREVLAFLWRLFDRLFPLVRSLGRRPEELSVRQLVRRRVGSLLWAWCLVVKGRIVATQMLDVALACGRFSVYGTMSRSTVQLICGVLHESCSSSGCCIFPGSAYSYGGRALPTWTISGG